MDQAPASIYLRHIKCIAHGNLSKSSLNTKSFYHGLKSFSCGLENQSRVFSLWYSKNSLSFQKRLYFSIWKENYQFLVVIFVYSTEENIFAAKYKDWKNKRASVFYNKCRFCYCWKKLNVHQYFTNKSVLWLLKKAFWRTSRDSSQCLHGKQSQLISQFRQSLKLSSLFWLMIFCDSQQHKLNKQNAVHLTTLRASYSYK